MARLNVPTPTPNDDASPARSRNTDPPLREVDVADALREIHLSNSPTNNDAIQKCHDLFERVRPQHDKIREEAWVEICVWLQHLTKHVSKATGKYRKMLSQLQENVTAYQRLHRLQLEKKTHAQYITLPERIKEHWEGDIEEVPSSDVQERRLFFPGLLEGTASSLCFRVEARREPEAVGTH